MENFAWNVRVLKGQADLVMQAKAECLEYMKQVIYLILNVIGTVKFT